MIEVQPGDSVVATVDGAPGGLTGTIGVTITDLAGTTVQARSTAGITEIRTGTYRKTLSGFTDPGDLLVIWDSGGASPLYATEDLTVLDVAVVNRVASDNITVVDRNGNVVANRPVWIYVRGTTNPATVYASAAGSTTVTQPLVTDGDGYPVNAATKAPVYVTNGGYDVQAEGFSRILHWEAGAAPAPAVTGQVATAESLDAAIDALRTEVEDYADAPPTAVSVAGNRTLALGDEGNVVLETTDGTPQTITVPPNSSVAFPIGSEIAVRRIGAGLVTFAQGAGVTIQAPGGDLTIPTQYGPATLAKRGTNTWIKAP